MPTKRLISDDDDDDDDDEQLKSVRCLFFQAFPIVRSGCISDKRPAPSGSLWDFVSPVNVD